MHYHHDNSLLTEVPVGINPLVLIILNGGSGLTKMFEHLWSSSQIKICADGGANHLYEATRSSSASHKYIPSFIKGDCDSIREDVMEYYKKNGTEVHVDKSQDTNDMDKCLQLVYGMQEQQQKDGTINTTRFNIVVLGSMGGRFDQEMQNVNALYRWTCFNRILLLSNSTLAFLLIPGKHEVIPNFLVERRTCGLIPIGKSCNSITTFGLQWDLHENSLEFGGLISTSNHIKGDRVAIETSDPIIWTTAL